MASRAWWVVVLAPGVGAFVYVLLGPHAEPEPAFPLLGAVVLTVAAGIQAAFRIAALAAPAPALARVVLLAAGLLVGVAVLFAGFVGIVLFTTCWENCSSDPSDGPAGLGIGVVALALAGLVWWGGARVWKAFGNRVHGTGVTPRSLLLLPSLPVYAAAGLAELLR